jgi:YD repeat-containing protein
VVDPTRDWVEWTGLTGFSTYDINLPVVSGSLAPLTGLGGGLGGGGGGSGGCAGDCGPPRCRQQETGASTVSRSDGALREVVELGPSGVENGHGLSPWSLRLVYSSRAVAPTALIEAYVHGGAWAPVPALGRNVESTATPYQLQVHGRRIAIDYEPGLPDWEPDRARIRYLFDGRTGAGTALPTGLYPFSVSVGRRFTELEYGPAACFGCPATALATYGVRSREPVDASVEDSGVVSLRNDIGSPFGAGWWLSGHKRLMRGPGADGSWWVAYDGNGSAEVFRGILGGEVVTVAGDGNPVWAGAGRPADRTAVVEPHGVAFDGDGRLWIAHRLTPSPGYAEAGYGALSVVGEDGNLVVVLQQESGIPSGDPCGRPLAGFQPRGLAWSAATGLVVVDGARLKAVACVPDPHAASGLACTIACLAGGGTYGEDLPVEGAPALGAYLEPSPGIWAGEDGTVLLASERKVWAIQGGVLHHVAGTGSPAWSGDGGLATLAGLGETVHAVARDPAGNTYVAGAAPFDAYSRGVIRRIDPLGTISTVLGGPGGDWTDDGEAAAGNPSPEVYSIATRSDGALFFGVWRPPTGADPAEWARSGAIRTIEDPGGRLRTVAGTWRRFEHYSGEGVPGSRSALGHPVALAVHPVRGDVYWADPVAHRVRRIANDGASPVLAAVAGTTSRLTAPAGAGLDPGGEIELTRRGGVRDVFVVLPDGLTLRHDRTESRDGREAIRFEYDASGRLADVRDVAGRSANLHYDATTGKLDSITDFSGQTTELDVDSSGDLVAVRLAGHAETERTFVYESGKHLLRAQTNGQVSAEYAYGPFGMVNTVRRNGRPFRTITPVAGRFLNNHLDGARGVLLTKVDSVDGDGAGFPFTTTVTDEAGVTREYAYGWSDVEGGWRRATGEPVFDLVRSIDVTGQWREYRPGPGSTTLGADLPERRRTYDGKGNVVQDLHVTRWATESVTSRVTWVYDPFCDQPTLRLGFRGDGADLVEMEAWAYDPLSCRLLSHTHELGTATATTTWQYGPDGRLDEVVDDNGWTTRYPLYDERGRLRRVERRDGSTTEIVRYDDADRVLEERTTGADGFTRTTTRTYNALGQLVEQCLTGGGCTTFDYEDSSGGGSCCGAASARRITVTDPDGIVSVRDYAEGRLVAVTAAPAGATTRAWDDAGRLASVADASGATTRFEYDGLGRPDRTLFRPITASTETPLVDLDYGAHRADRAFSTVTDGDGRASFYAWGDEPYRYHSMVEERPADADGWLSHSYLEPTGRPSRTSRNVGAATTLGWTDYQYDQLGRTTNLGYAHHGRSGRSVSWVYQQNEPAATDIGRLRWINDAGPLDPLAQVSFDYHPDGTVATEMRHQLGRDYVVGYEYAGLGDVSEVTYPSGLVVRFERDPAAPNRLLRIVAEDGGDYTLAEPIRYTTAGRLSGFVAGNGVEYGLDRTPAVHGAFIERVWAATSAWVSPPDLLDLSYTPDALGRIDSVADGVDPDRSVDYGYDPRGRLTSAVSDAWSLSWTYDVAGNRLTETRDGVLADYNLAPGTNRLTSVTDAATGGTVHFLEYDEFGSATQLDGLCFELDAADRLVRLRAAGAGGCDATASILEEYDYDYRSRRTVRRECGGESAASCSPTLSCTVFVHDRQSRLIAEHDCATGDVLAEYVYLEGHRLLAARRSGSWYWYLGDHLGVPRKVVDEGAAVVWDGAWEPFGVVDEAPSSTIPQPFRLPGQYETRHPFFSPDQHLYYNHHRWYLPGLGRYTQVDPAYLWVPLPPTTAAANMLVGLPSGDADPGEPWRFPALLGAGAHGRVPRCGSGTAYGYAASDPIRAQDPAGLVPPEFDPFTWDVDMATDWPWEFDECLLRGLWGFLQCMLAPNPSGALGAVCWRQCMYNCIAGLAVGAADVFVCALGCAPCLKGVSDQASSCADYAMDAMADCRCSL